MGYALSTTVPQPFAVALRLVRAALADEGFGVVSEVDLAGTLKAKIDVDIPPQVILGACRPALAHAAVAAEPSIGLLLPCNVVVRAVDEHQTLVEAIDPAVMVPLTGNEGLTDVATEARDRLARALSALAGALAR